MAEDWVRTGVTYPERENQEMVQSRERAWIKASQKGDGRAFNHLVLMWERAIYGLAFRLLQDPEEAAEATQEAFLLAFRNIRKFKGKARFSTWLYRIACNHCSTRLRRRPQGLHYSLEQLSDRLELQQREDRRDSQEKELLRQERKQQVQLQLERLNEDQKVVVELKFFQDCTFEEISQILGTPLSTIKSRFYAALALLKSQLARSLDL